MVEKKPLLWCLFHKPAGRTIKGLLFDEARAYISNLDQSELQDWFVWKEDWPDWRPVHEVDGITETIFRMLQVSPPPPPRGASEKSIEIPEPSIRKIIENNSNHLQQSDGPFTVSDGEFIIRSKKRFFKRYEISIEGPQKKIFRTYSRDISVGGISFEESLPDWVTGYFKVRIAKPNSKQKIELMCCLVENQNSEKRFRVAILPLESVKDEKDFEHWLSAG